MGEEFITWEPKTVIYKFGDQADFAYLLKEGAVEILSENGTRVGYVNAKEVFGEEREDGWLKMDYMNNGGYSNYQQRTKRKIPVLILNLS